jgi:hypothetical protein
VDGDGFFERARIPADVKRIVGTQLKAWDEGLSSDLKEVLNTWQDTLNSDQTKVMEAIVSLGPVLTKFADSRLSAENSNPAKESTRDIAQVALREATENLIRAARAATEDRVERGAEVSLTATEEFLIQANTGINIALGFADFVLGLTPVGPVKDLIEAMTGVSVVAHPGAQLELNERVLLTVTGVAGIVTFGGSSIATKAIKGAFSGLTKVWQKSKLGIARSSWNSRILFKTNEILEAVTQITTQLTPGKVKSYLSNIQQIPRETLVRDMESIGLRVKGHSPDGRFMEFVDSHGKTRAKIHPPDAVTRNHHLHIYDSNGNSLNKALEAVSHRSPDAHIPIQEL